MRYAQIVMGMKDSGKSTYCKLMAKYAESRGRKMRIVNLDPTPRDLAYEHPLADIRDVVKAAEVEAADQATPYSGAGYDFALTYIIKNPDWLFGAIGEPKDGDYILFDCPGMSPPDDTYYVFSKAMKLFATMLVVKHFRTCGICVRDSRQCLDGYNFIASNLTPLSSYISLSIPHVGLMMKIDLLSDDDKSKIQLLINSDIRDVLRYENAKAKSSPTLPEGQLGLAKACSTAVTVLEGHSLVRKKFYALNITVDESFKGFLDTVDELLGIVEED